eukprot:2886497-Pleurochrysis_carterae.AAC.2
MSIDTIVLRQCFNTSFAHPLAQYQDPWIIHRIEREKAEALPDNHELTLNRLGGQQTMHCMARPDQHVRVRDLQRAQVVLERVADQEGLSGDAHAHRAQRSEQTSKSGAQACGVRASANCTLRAFYRLQRARIVSTSETREDTRARGRSATRTTRCRRASTRMKASSAACVERGVRRARLALSTRACAAEAVATRESTLALASSCVVVAEASISRERRARRAAPATRTRGACTRHALAKNGLHAPERQACTCSPLRCRGAKRPIQLAELACSAAAGTRSAHCQASLVGHCSLLFAACLGTRRNMHKPVAQACVVERGAPAFAHPRRRRAPAVTKKGGMA